MGKLEGKLSLCLKTSVDDKTNSNCKVIQESDRDIKLTCKYQSSYTQIINRGYSIRTNLTYSNNNEN